MKVINRGFWKYLFIHPAAVSQSGKSQMIHSSRARPQNYPKNFPSLWVNKNFLGLPSAYGPAKKSLTFQKHSGSHTKEHQKPRKVREPPSPRAASFDHRQLQQSSRRTVKKKSKNFGATAGNKQLFGRKKPKSLRTRRERCVRVRVPVYAAQEAASRGGVLRPAGRCARGARGSTSPPPRAHTHGASTESESVHYEPFTGQELCWTLPSRWCLQPQLHGTVPLFWLQIVWLPLTGCKPTSRVLTGWVS